MGLAESSTKVSVIIPVYNSYAYLEKCVQSILDQGFNGCEFILIDDGSTDGSSELCDRLATAHHEIKVIHQKNRGICEARNVGIRQATGEYIAFSDHDDLVKQGFLEDNYKLAILHSADVVKFGRESIVIDVEGKKKSIHTRRFPARILDEDDIKKDFLKLRFGETMNCVWDGLFKRDFLVSNCLEFDPAFRMGGEDIAFCSKCYAVANRIVFSDKVYYEHYIREGYSTSTKNDPLRLEKYRNLMKNLDDCIEKLHGNYSLEEYLAIICKESIYPSIVHYVKTGASTKEIIRFLRSITWKKERYRFSEIKQLGGKWGLFSYLLYHRLYWLMILIVRIRKIR